MQKIYEESTVEFITHLAMNKKNFKDAYDIGENIAVFSGEETSKEIQRQETCLATSLSIGLLLG